MTKTALLLAAAAALLSAPFAHAADPDLDAYVRHAAQAASAKVQAAGVDPAGLSVKAYVSGDGRLTGVHVVHSTGSLEADQKAVAALRRFDAGTPPPFVSGAQVTLALGAPIVQAKTP